MSPSSKPLRKVENRLLQLPLFSWLEDVRIKSSRAHLERALVIGVASELPGVAASGYLTRLLSEGAMLIAGKTRGVFESTSDLPLDFHNVPEVEQTVWAERMFLRGLASLRLGEAVRGRELWAKITAAMSSFDVSGVIAKIRVEEASLLMNRGLPGPTKAKILEVLSWEDVTWDVYTLSRCYGIFASVSMMMGKFDDAGLALDNEAAVLQRLHPPSLVLANKCRRISLALSSDDFSLAERLFRAAWEDRALSPNSHALLLKYGFQLASVRRDLSLAQSYFEQLNSLLETQGIAPQFIDSYEEACEVYLSQKKDVELFNAIREVHWKAIVQADLRTECIAKLSLARAQLHSGAVQEALQSSIGALQIAEVQDYGPILVRCFLQTAVAAFFAKDTLGTQKNVLSAERLIRRLNLRTHLAFVTFLKSFLLEGAHSTKGLLDSLRFSDVGEGFEYLCSLVALQSQETFVVKSSGEAVGRLSPEKLRGFLRSNFGIYYFQNDGTAAVSNGDGVARVELQGLIAQCLQLFLTSPKHSVSFSAVHHLQSEVEFTDWKHLARVRVLVSRVRKVAQQIGLTILNEPEGYRAEFSLPFFVVSTLRAGAREQKKISPAAVKILAYLEDHGKATTKELGTKLKITRQALHPHLKALERNGAVKMIQFGPHTYYILVTASL